MKLIRVLCVAAVLSIVPASTAVAQFEGSDAAYAQKRREERSNRSMIKLGIAGVFLVISGGAWVVKKIRGKE